MRNYPNKTFRPNVRHILVWNKGFGSYYFCRPIAEDNHGRCKDMRRLLRKKAKRKEQEYYRNIINEEIYDYNLDKQGYEEDFDWNDWLFLTRYEF